MCHSTYMMLEGLVGHRGTGIVVKAGISALWRRSGSAYERPYIQNNLTKNASMHLACITLNHIPAFSGLCE